MQQDPSIPWSPLPPVAAPPSLPPPLCPAALAPLVTAKFTAWLMEDNYPHRALCREDTEARVHVVLDLLHEALLTCNKMSTTSSTNIHPQPLEGHQVLQLWEDNKTLLEPLVDRDSTSLHCWRSFLSFLKQHPNDYKCPPTAITKSSNSSSSSTASTASSKRHHADVKLGPAGNARSSVSKNKKHIVSSNITTRAMVPPPPLPLLPPSCLKSGSSTSAAHPHQATATPATAQSKRVRFHVASDEDRMTHATRDDKNHKHASALQSAPVQHQIYPPPPPPPSTSLNTAGGPLFLPSPLPSLYASPFSAPSSSSSTTYTKASKKKGKAYNQEQQVKKRKKKTSAPPSSLLSSLLHQAHNRSQEQQMQQQVPQAYQGFYQQQGYVPVCYLPGKGVIYGKPSMSSGAAAAAPPPLPTPGTDLLKLPPAITPPAPTGAGEILSELPAAAPLPRKRRYSSSNSVDVLVKMRAQSKRHCHQGAAVAHEPLSVVERGRRKKKVHGNEDGRKYGYHGDGGEEMDAVVHTLLSLASAGPQHSDQEQALHDSNGQENGGRIIQSEEDQHRHHERPQRQERVMIHV